MPNYYDCRREFDKFSFFTDHGTQYDITFQEFGFLNDEIGSEIVYSLAFYPVGERQKGLDPKIKNTIIKVAEDFLNVDQNAILYVCDISDGLQEARYLLFNSWIEKTEGDEYELIDFSTSDIYGQLVFRKDNEYYDEIYRAIDKYKVILSVK